MAIMNGIDPCPFLGNNCYPAIWVYSYTFSNYARKGDEPKKQKTNNGTENKGSKQRSIKKDKTKKKCLL